MLSVRLTTLPFLGCWIGTGILHGPRFLAWTHLLKKHSWVFQVDLDAAFMNFYTRLESFLDDRYDIIVARDCYVLRELQEPTRSFNTGAIFLKSSPWTLEFLAKVWTLNSTDVPNIRLWWEQAGFMHALRLDPTTRQHVKIVPGRQFNAWPFQNRAGGIVTKATVHMQRLETFLSMCQAQIRTS